MKFSLATLSCMSLLLANNVAAFAPHSSVVQKRASHSSSGRFMAMDLDMPPAENAVAKQSDLPVVVANQYGQPTDVRYSDFLRLVNADRIEKVTFSADGTQLLGVDVDGARVKIESLPNDPDLLNSLTGHKVS